MRPARAEDGAFVVEMARLACTLEGRPLPAADAPAVLDLLPDDGDAVLVASDDDGDAPPAGAAWWHLHEPPLMRDAEGEPLPELPGVSRSRQPGAAASG